MSIKQNLPTAKWIKRGALAFVGFLLSPLSWWNDIFINIPLAYGFAWLSGKFLDLFLDIRRWLFLLLFVSGYFLTNLAGFLMIHYSIVDGGKKDSAWKSILVALFYTLIIVALSYLDIFHLPLNLDVLPSWVIK